jgi:membrane-associated protease RseP (regulator of RpoE activity)
LSPTGTCGAVILMDGMKADRKQIFDIGLAGPLAGLVFAIPIAAIGLMYGEPPQTRGYSVQFGQPIAIQILAQALPMHTNVDGKTQAILEAKSISNESMNPLLMAAWVGLLVTGLNMVPISQLDGGHVIHGLLGRDAPVVSWWAYIACVCYVMYISIMFNQPMFILMLILIPIMGIAHPPSRDDSIALGLPRQILGIVSLSIPILCVPFRPIIIL